MMLRTVAKSFALTAACAVALSAIGAPAWAKHHVSHTGHASHTSKSSPKQAHTTSSPTSGKNTPLGTFKDWSAYIKGDPTKKVCFVVSEPKSKSMTKGAHRGDPFFLVTRWSATQALQPSALLGYTQAPGSKAKVMIGDDKFDLFVDGDGAWMETEDGDKKLLDAMMKGATLVVESASAKGTKSSDKYSLAGLSEALDKAQTACK
jgi:invasion protein IalB